MNKIAYIVLVVVILGIIGFAIYQTTKSQTNSNSGNTSDTSQSTPGAPEPADTTVPGAIAILFYGNGCPHCANVDKWLEENKVAEKVKFDRKEVWYNKDNSNLLGEKAKACGIADDQVGVPFLYDTVNNKCYIGEIDVENFFKGKL
ncbi:hypothetical protein AUJ40_01490 [Candidatus Berkelbacteria bacterium CG1_02_42_45]|uniref:Glutaredoxin domain-containing protein n=4 Tax=Candidatus Berkelbacteria TaxID=1618330 RepID=A0A2M7K1P9_9BACT|nr:MAG: hypothetical protein AUJ40_01490 [Candidatus Berkelbacteria bacterium CG1_02_42_45]PIR27069.1 MAG: hypothetical protein COV40_02830 [Candidatus Berkelbacteria bacterium CG11_big_fil_rev_8_21_14_0_20_42_15]PIX30187.1 MAG: hypothetical protein COZ63_01045 [Candidatus Berkelbacteria bacterium CG_4_8_14_3_um_filter_42_13]PIZ27847.1 MAG: hypothetical protein COY45_00235 [Candidatus Berkelbacteria bacterium CG_4_10_14_0_8_um_filter_42_34]